MPAPSSPTKPASLTTPAYNIACTDCDRVTADPVACLATCCAGDDHLPALLCPRCLRQHEAQFYLDARGFVFGHFGSDHERIVRLLADYRGRR